MPLHTNCAPIVLDILYDSRGYIILFSRFTNPQPSNHNVCNYISSETFRSKCIMSIQHTNKQEAHGPHRSPEKPVQINKHIWAIL